MKGYALFPETTKPIEFRGLLGHTNTDFLELKQKAREYLDKEKLPGLTKCWIIDDKGNKHYSKY